MVGLRRILLGTVSLIIAGSVLVMAMSAGAGTGQAPGLGELKRLADKRAKPTMPRAGGKPNRKGKTPKSKVKTLGKRGARGSAPKGRSPNELNWDGWPSPLLRQVGQIWAMPAGESKFIQYCSGTVVTRGLVLTAGHCVVNSHAKVNGLFPYHTRILFVPGQTWRDPNSNDPTDVTANWGVWEAYNYWAPDSYRNGSGGPDWGLMEITPQNGKYIGDSVGSWRIQTGITFNTGARIWATGYPASGIWRTTRGYVGRGQYACDATWDGVWQNLGGTRLWLKCPMNGGASGGPWLVQLNSGEWVIGGVNNWCDDPIKYDDESAEAYCTPTSQSLISLVFDARFITFWNSVLPQLRY